jgi:uncharacterized protein YqeY
MTLKETLKEDMKAAFKAGDQVTRGTISLLLSLVQNRELEKRSRLMKEGMTSEADVAAASVLTDDEVMDALMTEIKKRRESMSTYEAAGRPELAASEQGELAVLMRYMPEQITEDAVRALIGEAIASTGAKTVKDIGTVMGTLAPKIKGRFDGARASQLVRESLQSA